MTLALYLVAETPKARLWRKKDAKPEDKDFWAPRSVCEHVTKFPAEEGKLPLCHVTFEDWYAEKENL